MYSILGKRWEFVWGEGSKSYSEEVIRSYICRHGSTMMRRRNRSRQFSIRGLAAIHAGGSIRVTNETKMFVDKVWNLSRMGKFDK